MYGKKCLFSLMMIFFPVQQNFPLLFNMAVRCWLISGILLWDGSVNKLHALTLCAGIVGSDNFLLLWCSLFAAVQNAKDPVVFIASIWKSSWVCLPLLMISLIRLRPCFRVALVFCWPRWSCSLGAKGETVFQFVAGSGLVRQQALAHSDLTFAALLCKVLFVSRSYIN